MCPPDTTSATSGKRRLGELYPALRLEPCGVDVPLEVVDADERQSVHEREALREVDADEQGARQPGPVGHGDPVDVGPVHAGIGEGCVEDRHDPAQVRAGRDLRDDPARRRVQRDLARDDVAVDGASTFDERNPGLVAAALDRQEEWPAHGSGSVGSAWSRSSSARRSRAIRSRIEASASASVVMISASSLSSL